MDILCPVCAEPWEVDELHFAGRPFPVVYRHFQREGCVALGSAHGNVETPRQQFAADATAELMAVLGDDVDGLASLLDDFGLN